VSARKQGLPADRRLLPLAAAGLAALLLAGCSAVPERVVLLPQADGSPSAVELRRGDQRLVLDQPYAASELVGNRLQPRTLDATTVRERYGALITGQPARPQRFVVRFEPSGTQLGADAAGVLAELRTVLARLPAAEVVVTGHTDRVGTLESNDRLSLTRAETVRDILVTAGVPRNAVTVAGRGEREPEVPTADEVAEPRNRRVEIKLR